MGLLVNKEFKLTLNGIIKDTKDSLFIIFIWCKIGNWSSTSGIQLQRQNHTAITDDANRPLIIVTVTVGIVILVYFL